MKIGVWGSKRLAILFSVLLGGLLFVVTSGAQDRIQRSDLQCVTPGEFFQSPEKELEKINVGPIAITPATVRGGSVVPLAVDDCNGDGNLNAIIPWSEEGATQYSRIEFSPNLCDGRAPQYVEIEAIYGTPISLIAYNDRGELVDRMGDPTASRGSRVLNLSSESGIRYIEVKGAEICIVRICWLCGIQKEPEPTPELPNCFHISDYYKEPSWEERIVQLPGFRFIAPLDSNNKLIPLSVYDCGSNGEMGVYIPWSERGASQFATIQIDPQLCKDKVVSEVVISLIHYIHAVLVAYDANGARVDAVVVSDSGVHQQVGLSNPAGIHLIEIIGSEICITGICWSCDDIGTEPDPQTPDREWVPLIPDARPGTPIQATVVESNEKQTVVELITPGFWLSEIEYGGSKFTRVDFPEVAELGGLGFEKEGDEWFQFPHDTAYPRIDGDRYRRSMYTRIAKPDFPEKLAHEERLSELPRTGEEMLKQGIDPAGARPGVPVLAGLLAVEAHHAREEFRVSVTPLEIKELKVHAPLAPAGYTGLDQSRPIPTREETTRDYIPPQLVDWEFYQRWPSDGYSGAEDPYSAPSGHGAFSVIEPRVPLMTAMSPELLHIPISSRITIEHPGGVARPDLPQQTKEIGWDAWKFKPPVINGYALREQLRIWDISILPIRLSRYLILTPSEYVENLQEFIQWKQSKGLIVQVWTVGSSTDDFVAANRDQIDAALEAYHQNWFWRSTYVLIVGDHDVIPAGRTNRIVTSPDFSDSDSDHVYAVIGDDRFASLHVGRLSVNNSTQLNAQLNKILTYERGGSSFLGRFSNWPRLVSLLANSENDDGSRGVSSSHPSKYAAAVNAIVDYSNYTNPPTFERYHAGASNFTTPRAVNQDVIDAINAGRGQVLYRGHGSGNSWLGGWDGSSTNGASFGATQINWV